MFVCCLICCLLPEKFSDGPKILYCRTRTWAGCSALCPPCSYMPTFGALIEDSSFASSGFASFLEMSAYSLYIYVETFNL